LPASANLLKNLKEDMMHINSALSYYAQELVYFLCEENPRKVVALIGLGAAAGLFMRRNLFAEMNALVNETKKTEKPSEDESSSSEEEEEDKENIAKKLERLKELGILNTFKK
jgi:hypothetical protein